VTALTPLEAALLDGIYKVSEYGWYSDELHLYAEGVERAQVGGVVASLVKKKIVRVEKVDGRECVDVVRDPRKPV
jgi:hypothetical protein